MSDPGKTEPGKPERGDRERRPNGSTAEGLDVLEARLGHRFADRGLLLEALTHPSSAPEDRGMASFGYERLEFLGDRVVGLVIAEWLLEKFPNEPEGSLARRHTALVRREALARVASAVDIGPFIILSLGEEGAGGRDNQAILADACEAVMAAIYLDGGLRAVSGFIRNAFLPIVEDSAAPPIDPKTALQEWAQARGLPLPRYDILSRTGPDHDPTFEIIVTIEGYEPVVASGQSKRSAEKEAAAAIMRQLPDGGHPNGE